MLDPLRLVVKASEAVYRSTPFALSWVKKIFAPPQKTILFTERISIDCWSWEESS